MLYIRVQAGRRKKHIFHIAGTNVNTVAGEFAYA